MSAFSEPTASAESLEALFQKFIREREFLKNVSPRTVDWYHCGWRTFPGLHSLSTADLGSIKNIILEDVARQRSSGVKAISVNSRLRVVNAFLRWMYTEEHLPKRVKIPRLKEPQVVLTVFSHAEVKTIASLKASGLNQSRAQAMAMLIADTGLRTRSRRTTSDRVAT